MQAGAGLALAALRERLGGQRVRDDEQARLEYGCDRTTLWSAAPLAVAFPESAAEVQAIVAIAREHRLALVPSGGRTGLSGGAVAARGELVVSLERMDRVLAFDAVDSMLSVEAGMITARVQQEAAARGLCYPVDFASSGSSQIGGNIATNAGGIKVIRHGMTRAQVTGLTVVDGRGELLELNRGLLKNNAGPDLRHLFIGSEGVLGIITAATLQLQRAPGELQVLLLAVRDFPAILELLQRARERLDLTAFEFFADNALRRVLDAQAVPAPFATRAPFYALLEYERQGPRGEEPALAVFEDCLQRGLVQDGVQSASLAQARQLWRLREDISETLARWTPWKTDISVRVGRMADFVARAESLLLRRADAPEAVWYGHVGDGNLHLNLLKPQGMAAVEFARSCAPLAHELAALLQEFGGSISAEHGIGLLKKEHLASTLGRAEIERLRELKRVFDPDGILNPGKIIDL